MNLIQLALPHNPALIKYARYKKTGLLFVVTGLFFLMLSFTSAVNISYLLFFLAAFCATSFGAVLYWYAQYKESPPGVKKNKIQFLSVTSRGNLGWGLAIFLTLFYIFLYWFPEMLSNIIKTTDPLSYLMRGQPSDQWFLYGTMYTLTVIVMGIRMILQNRHNKYQIIRTFSVIFFQLVLAFLLPVFLASLNQPGFYFSYFWPLKYEYLFPSGFEYLINSGGFGQFCFFWALIMTFIAVPVLTFFFGKRWYCSWVCGCGGLAETLGDPFRHLSDKSLSAWKFERWMIHSVLVAIILLTSALWINHYSDSKFLGNFSESFSKTYGFLIGAAFAGVAGVGFYPLLGSRVWCRFGCPLAAILGLLQKKFSRFRITTNGGQCISCGNCSTFCEMGIDVRSYAQRGENIVRSSCVGCGICAEVCPRGVLKLENDNWNHKLKSVK